MSLTIREEGFSDVSKGLRSILITKLPDALSRTANVFGIQVRQAARKLVAVDTGELKNSITSTVQQITDGYSLEVGPEKSYGKDIEFGRQPGTYVSPQSLQRWASRKGLNAWAVARSIEKKGSPAQPFLFPAFDQLEPTLVYILAKALEEVINLD